MSDPMTSNPFRPLSPDSLFALELPNVEYAIDEIAPLGAACLLSGREKAGKGLIALDACASIVLGEPFLGRDVRQGTAIYCAAEEDIRDVRDRVDDRIGDRRDVPLYILPLDGSTGDRLQLNDPESMQRLWDMVDLYKPRIIVLDPMRELHDRQEDNADEMAPLLRPVRQLAHQTSTMVMVTHHQNRAGSFRGSTAIRAAFDLEWEFTRTDGDADNENESPRGRLRVEGRHGPRQVIHMRLGEGLRWDVAQPVAKLREPGTRVRILEYLLDVEASCAAGDIAEGIGAPKHTVQNVLTEMTRERPCPLVVLGTGTKTDPRRYRISVAGLREFEPAGEG
jgi:hypothetical protein